MDALLKQLIVWLHGTRLAHIMNQTSWGWPTAESIHFVGLCLLIGAVGMFDLRMMGFAKRVPLGALHRLVPWGVLGYAMNVCTGIAFLTARLDLFLYNPAFQLKILFMLLAGINVLIFYSTMYRQVSIVGGRENAPMGARIAAVVSLVSWVAIIVCGRMLTFYKPPWYWCPWC